MAERRESERTTGVAEMPALVLERLFDAPRELVFEAWTNPGYLARWWGPGGFTNPRCEVDARPGGAIRIDMCGPDGTIYPMTGRFEELVPPERIVMSAQALDADGNAVLEDLTTVTFEERDGRTLVTLTARLLRVTGIGEEYAKGMEEGWTQSLDRLEDVVPSMGPEAPEEIFAVRLFDASRDLLFRMWTDPQHVGRWWGPRGFTTTTHELDVRPGGVWRHTMHGPDGRDHPNDIRYVDVVAPRRIVYDHGPAPRFRVSVSFAEEGTKTRLSMRMRFESAAARDGVVKAYGAAEGLQQTLARLEEELAAMDPGAFVISRVFDASRDAVWKAWTEGIAKWFGPKGFTTFHSTNDLRPGGVMHYGLRAPNGGEMWGRWIYREVVPPERLVFVSSFSDVEAGLTRAPFFDDWPLETLTTVTLAEEDGRTRVTLRAVPISATAEERARFDGMHGSMTQGWSGTFVQLAEHLAGN